jgi:phosphoglycerate dehydrogenase-like enzyme
VKVWLPHKLAIPILGELPAHVVVEIADDPAALPSDPGDVRFWVPTFLDQPSLRHLVHAMPDLEVLQLPSVGTDGWIDEVPASVTLCHGGGVHDASTSDWVLGAILAQLRGFPGFFKDQQAHSWAHRPSKGLTGRRIVLIGSGAIGSAVARRLAPFEVDLVKVARTPRPAEGVHGVADLPALLPTADVVILLVPLTEQTRGLVDRGFLAAMPDGALLVNAARGPVVDTAALVDELASGRLAAALDVTDPEPLPPEHPLWSQPNTVITPHVAARTEDMTANVYRLVAEQLHRFVAGEPVRNQVAR